MSSGSGKGEELCGFCINCRCVKIVSSRVKVLELADGLHGDLKR